MWWTATHDLMNVIERLSYMFYKSLANVLNLTGYYNTFNTCDTVAEILSIKKNFSNFVI